MDKLFSLKWNNPLGSFQIDIEGCLLAASGDYTLTELQATHPLVGLLESLGYITDLKEVVTEAPKVEAKVEAPAEVEAPKEEAKEEAPAKSKSK